MFFSAIFFLLRDLIQDHTITFSRHVFYSPFIYQSSSAFLFLLGPQFFFFFFEQYRPEKEKGTAQDRGAGGQVGLEDAVLIGERGTLALGPKRGRGFYMLCVNVFFFFFPRCFNGL